VKGWELKNSSGLLFTGNWKVVLDKSTGSIKNGRMETHLATTSWGWT
jgi:hypothetical protein